ncbi:MAG: putative porin, partial [Flavicella sp.]
TGLRSLGTYRNALSSIKSFRGTMSYTSKNKRYALRAHLANQNIYNQENGGLTEIAKGFFENKDPEYEDRGRLDVNLEDANTSLIGKRYYIDHNLKLLNSKDSISSKLNNLKLGHVFSYETKNYYFRSSNTAFFGNSFTATTDDKTSHKSMNNEVYLNFTSPYVLGNFRVKAGIHNLYQGYKKIVNFGTVTIPNQIEQQASSLGAHWKASLKNIHINAEATTLVQGDLEGSNLFVEAAFVKNKKVAISSSIQLNSKAPAINYTFYQSNFAAYNWINDFKNIQTRNLNIGIKSKWLNANAALKSIDNFTYFNDAAQSSPSQYSGTITSFKAQAQREFKLGDFALNTDIIYQKVTAGSSVFKQPDFLGRSSFYFSKYLFKKRSMFLQTGITANYFSAYEANAYNPVLGEFTLQNSEMVGGKPILDFFINAEIRRTRVYFTFENLMAFSNSNYYYATPNNPYRDFVFRFGFVWNFFR